jgi:hypothetical protein
MEVEMTDTAVATATPAVKETPDGPTKMSLGMLASQLGIVIPDAVSLGKPKSMAIMAEPGTGKTTLLGGIIKVPEFANAKIAYVDIEDGANVWALDPQIKHAVDSGQITILPIPKNDPLAAKQKLDQLFGYTDENGQKRTGALFSPAFDVDVIMIDTFSGMQEIGLEYFMATTRNQAGVVDGMAAYGKLAPWTNAILWELQLGNPFGIVTSHTMEKKDKKTGVEKLTMKLAGSAKDNVAAIPDLVAYMAWQTIDEEEPQVSHLVAHMSQSPDATLKNRYGFTEPMWDFTLPSLFAAINTKIDASKAVVQSVTQSTN